MIDGYLLNTRVFRKVEDSKGQALKPLEEAAEIFGAWQELDSMRRSPFFSAWRDMREELIDECMGHGAGGCQLACGNRCHAGRGRRRHQAHGRAQRG